MQANQIPSVVAIIPARGGSKGIPKKNLLDICGKPLVAWSILQAKASVRVDEVFVTSDCEEILKIAETYGAKPIRRPQEISGDTATSESAWMHAMDFVENSLGKPDLLLGMQPTSPLREPSDLDNGIDYLVENGHDSVLSVNEIEDFFIWQIGPDGMAVGVNHDPANRKRRQEIQRKYLENGSFYVFKPDLFRKYNNRIAGNVGLFQMAKHKMFQIDNFDDVELCSAIMRGYGLDRVSPRS